MQVHGFTVTSDGDYERHRVIRVKDLLPHQQTYLDFFQLADAHSHHNRLQPSGLMYALAQIGPERRQEEQLVTLHKDSISQYRTVQQCRTLMAQSGFQQPALDDLAQQVTPSRKKSAPRQGKLINHSVIAGCSSLGLHAS